MSDLAPIDVSFNQATKAAELQLKFIEALAEARHKDMQTASLEQHVVNQRLNNYTKAKTIQQFEIDIVNFRKKKHQLEQRAQRFATFGSHLNQYVRIEWAESLKRENIFSAYKALTNEYPGVVYTAMQHTFTTSDIEKITSPANWVAAVRHSVAEVKLPGLECTNAAILVEH